MICGSIISGILDLIKNSCKNVKKIKFLSENLEIEGKNEKGKIQAKSPKKKIPAKKWKKNKRKDQRSKSRMRNNGNSGIMDNQPIVRKVKRSKSKFKSKRK